MTTPYPSPYCALGSCKILGENNEAFLDNCKKLQKKKGKKGKKGPKNADVRLFLTFLSFFLHFEPKKKFKISKKLF